MDAGQLEGLLQQHAQFLQQTVEQQTNAHTLAMNAMAEMVRALQIDVRASAESKFLVKDRESMTTKRAFTMLPHYLGKVEEYETWRCQFIQFLSQEPYFVEFLEWIENDLGSENQHFTAVLEKNLEHEDAVRDVCADHSNPPTPQEKKEENETRVMYPQLGWYNQQLYQVLALNFKGEALAMIKAVAAGEYEATRGVTAWYRLTGDHRGSSAQRILGLVGRVFQPQRCQKMCQTCQATLSCRKVAHASTRSWSTRRRKFRQMCQTVAKFSSSAAWYPETY